MKRNTLIAIGITAVIAAALFLTLDTFRGSEQPEFVSQPEAATSEEAPDLDISDANVEIETDYSSLVAEFVSGELTHEQQEWMVNRGYYFDHSVKSGFANKVHSYDPLPNSALQELADSGDLLAASMLGDRLLVASDAESTKRGLEMHEKAAALGSTYSSLVIGNHHLNKAATGNPLQDLISLGDGLAWHYFSSWRGDYSGDIQVSQLLETTSIDESVLFAVCSRADDLKQKLINERKQAGLLEFDNSPMPGTKKYLDAGVIKAKPDCPSQTNVLSQLD